MNLQLKLLDADDFKMLEDTLARALVRALRTVMKEGTIAGYKPPAAETFAAPQPPPAPAPEPVPAPAPAPAHRPSWQPMSAALTDIRRTVTDSLSHAGNSPASRREEAADERPEPRTAGPLRSPQPERQKRGPNRRWTEFCKSVPSRPNGYVTTDEAVEHLVKGPRPLKPDSAAIQLRHWIYEGRVTGVIVCDNRLKPTKGYPGRLMVDRSTVIAADEIRQRNAALPPYERRVPQSPETAQGGVAER